MIRILPCLATIAALGVAACSGSGLPMCASAEAGARPGLESYVLGPGDAVRMTVFRHENLSGEFEIDGTGTLAVPLLGDIDAGGLTTTALADRIAAGLEKQQYLVDPRVSIEVLTHRPFYVMGEVAAPGEYEYQSGMTVTGAVAVAGGYTYRADEDDVVIRRKDCAVPATPSTRVLPGEVVMVPERLF